MTAAPDPAAALRKSAYLLLTAVAVAIAAAKVVGAENVFEPSRYKPPKEGAFGGDRDADFIPARVWPAVRPEPTPTFSSNDKSRWATVRALVDEGTYVIGRRADFRSKEYNPENDRGIVFEDDYRSLDKVMNPDTGAFYSSKPPLFPTLVAGEYWLLKTLFGWSIVHDRWWVICTVLLTVNVLPFAVYLVLLARLIEDYGKTDFGRLFVFCAACFGTFVLTFSHTLNNHTPAVYCVLFALVPMVKKRPAGESESVRDLLLSGFFAGLAVTLELPSLAFAAGLALPLLVVRTRRTLLGFVPGFLIPVVALLYCNRLALGQFIPAYSEFGGPWYNYAGSHWLKVNDPTARGIDFNREPTHVYAFHLLVGHHGWFSLTPVWLVGLYGLVVLVRRLRLDVIRVWAFPGGRVWSPTLLAGLTMAVSLVVFGFYLTRTKSYNYGGFTSGPRWLFWLTPLWLLAALPAADRMAKSRIARGLAAGLLGLSVLSVFYPAWNPWRHPWILQLCELLGWVRY